MATQPTNNAVPSESPRDLKFNAGKIDEFVTSLALKYQDRFGGEHYTIEGLRWLAQQAIAEFGWIPVGTFQAGATLTLPNQILKDTTDGEYYRWDGTLPKNVPAGSTPANSGGVGDGKWVSVGDAYLRNELNMVTRTFATVAEMVAKGGLVGQRAITLGYYTAGDGGGAEYIITSGAPAQDYTDAGSVVLDSTKFAKLIQKESMDLKQFGVKPSDRAFAASNDIFIAQAITRSRFGFTRITISDVIYIKKPLVFEYYHHMEGKVIGSDASFTPRFVKIDNSSSGIAPLAYPGVSDTVPYDVDAGIILKRQNAAADFCRGVTLKNFLIQSELKSLWAVYAPHAADFDIDIDSRGFNGGIRGNVNFLFRYAGRHVGLGANAADQTTAIGLWFSHFSTVLDCGNSGNFRLSFNNFNRGMQTEYFGNGVLDRCTFESIKKQVTGAPTSFAFFTTDSSFTGQISCESSSTCIVRAGNNSNIDITLSSVFHVTQDDTSEGLIHVLSGGRLTLRPSFIMADAANTKIINESGGYLDIAANTRMSNISITNLDNYRYKDRGFGFSQTGATTATSYASGAEVTFASLVGVAKAALSGGTVQFSSPALVKITLVARGISSGSVVFGLNGTQSESLGPGQQSVLVTPVVSGDVLNVKAASALTLATNGGIKLMIEPVF